MKQASSIVSIILFIAGSFLYTRTEDIGSNLSLFNTGFIISAIGYIGILYWGFSSKKTIWHVTFWALVIIPRLFAINLNPSDDLARYIWEGKIVIEGYSPYDHSPDDPELTQFRDEEIYPKINHKDMPAIYPPAAIYIFALLTKFVQSMQGFRIFMLLFELPAIIMILIWLKSLGLPKERALIYALNPLVIIGIAGHGHLDSLQVFIIVFSLYLYSRNFKGWGIALMIMAGMIKFLAFLALPFLITRKTIKHIPLCIALVAVGYLPVFLLDGGFSFGNMGVFAGNFEFYSLTFAPLRILFGTSGAVWSTIVIIALSIVGLWLTKSKPEQAIAPLFLIVTLMSTTVHYWYLIPVLALAVVWPTRYLIALSLLFLPYFDVFGLLVTDNIWRGELLRQIITYVPFLILFLVEMTGRWPGFRKSSLSVGAVIPVLNDSSSLKKLLDSIAETGIDRKRVVVADGGSHDGSEAIGSDWGAKVVKCKRAGRGFQIGRGVDDLNTDLIVVLHADNVVQKNIFESVKKSANAYPHAVGGACRLVYMDKNIKMAILSFLSDIKMSIFGLSFGDQGQWFRRNAIKIPELPLMEDIELAMGINGKGPAVWTPSKVYVSTRRYKKIGLWKGAIFVIRLSITYLIKRRWRDEAFDTSKLYKEYYALK